MAIAIRPVRVNHLNLVVEDFDSALARLHRLFGAELLMDLPQREWHAAVIDIGRALFEIFVPPAFLLNSRHGPHYLGIEYQADMDEVRAALTDHGIGIVRDIGVALHTWPADCCGIALEFYDSHFHDNDALLGRPMQPAAYWRDRHPLGLTGLAGYSVATWDIEAASRFFCNLLSAQMLNDEARPDIAGQVRRFQVADSWVELITPDGEGVTRDHLRRAGEGIWSSVLAVANGRQAHAHFNALGIILQAGTAPGRIALSPVDSLGVWIEFDPG